MSKHDDYPGRQIPDNKRSPRGLGWEYRRRDYARNRCPFGTERHRLEFFHGYDNFVCTNPDVNEAMLKRGVPIE